VGELDHRFGDAAQQCSPEATLARAAHHYQPSLYLLGNDHYLRCRLSHTQVRLCDSSSSRFYLLDFIVEQLSLCPLDIRQEVWVLPHDPSRFQRCEIDEGCFVEALPADVDNVQLRASLLRQVRRRPRSLGLPFSLWTLRRLADYMAEQTGIRVEYETVRVHLKAVGIVLSRPQHTITSPDPEYALKKRRSKRPATLSGRETTSTTPRSST
jgi:hypothetical protein